MTHLYLLFVFVCWCFCWAMFFVSFPPPPTPLVVHFNNSSLYVYKKLSEFEFVPTKVQLGQTTESYFEVKSGIQPGDIISLGPNFLFDSEAKLMGSSAQSDHWIFGHGAKELKFGHARKWHKKRAGKPALFYFWLGDTLLWWAARILNQRTAS